MSKVSKIRTIDYVAGVDEVITKIDKMAQGVEPYGDAHLFAAYLRRQKRQHRISTTTLAELLRCPRIYVKMALESKIPAAKIDRHFLETVADVFGDDPAAIFSLISRPFYADTNQEEVVEAKHQLSQYILSEVNNAFFATIDERYGESDAKHELYDQVIGEIERIIAKQRRDLRYIEKLVQSLDNPKLTQTLNQQLAEMSTESDRQTIIYMRKNLQRIIEHFGGEFNENIG